MFLLLFLFEPLLLLIVFLLELLQLLVLPLLELLLSLYGLLLSLFALLLLSWIGLLLLPPRIVLVELLPLLDLLLFDLLALLVLLVLQILKFLLVLLLELRAVVVRAGIAAPRRGRTVVIPAGIAGALGTIPGASALVRLACNVRRRRPIRIVRPDNANRPAPPNVTSQPNQ